MLSARDMNEIADAPTGAVQSFAMKSSTQPADTVTSQTGVIAAPTKTAQAPEQVTMTYASVGKDGKVKFEEAS